MRCHVLSCGARQAPLRCVMRCHDLHAHSAYPVACSGMASGPLSPSFACERGPRWRAISQSGKVFSSCTAAGPLPATPGDGRGEFERPADFLKAASVSVPHVVPSSRFVLLRSVLPAVRLPKRRDPDSRVSCAGARVPACARFAAARIARLIARTRRRAHVSRAFLRGFFAPARTAKRSGPGNAASFLLLPIIAQNLSGQFPIAELFPKKQESRYGFMARFHLHSPNGKAGTWTPDRPGPGPGNERGTKRAAAEPAGTPDASPDEMCMRQPPRAYRIHTSPCGGVALLASIRRPGPRAGAQPQFSQQPRQSDQLSTGCGGGAERRHRLVRRVPRGIGSQGWVPAFAGTTKRGQRPAQPGCQAHRMHAHARCVHAVAPRAGATIGALSSPQQPPLRPLPRGLRGRRASRRRLPRPSLRYPPADRPPATPGGAPTSCPRSAPGRGR